MPIEWLPGQYLDVSLRPFMTKHFTIASAPYEKEIRITTKIPPRPSKYKKSLYSLTPGQNVKLGRPQGELIVDQPQSHYILIAGGIGITPYRAIIWDAIKRRSKNKFTLLYTNSDQKIPFRKSLQQFKQDNHNLKVQYFILPKRISEEDIIRLAKGDIRFLISGPPAMVEYYVAMLRRIGVPQHLVRADYFIGYLDRP